MILLPLTFPFIRSLKNNLNLTGILDKLSLMASKILNDKKMV